jgi:hypothetical protein
LENSVDSSFVAIGIGDRGEWHVADDEKTESVVELKRLLFLLTQDDEGFRAHIVPRLCLGDMWWIPDEITGFGGGQRHPWVIVKGFSSHRPNIVVCPRTTRLRGDQRGIITPAGILPDLAIEGRLVLSYRQGFAARGFREFEYIGRLSAEWVKKIEDFNRELTRRRRSR